MFVVDGIVERKSPDDVVGSVEVRQVFERGRGGGVLGRGLPLMSRRGE